MKNILFGISILLLASACASHDTKTVLLKKPNVYAANVEMQQFIVGAEAYDTDAKTKAAFDQKLVRKGIFPVQIALENLSNEETLLVVRDQIELDSNVATSIRPMGSAEVAESVEANAIAHAIFGFGILSYGAAKDANAEREADYANKQMPEELLVRPGRMNGGFVFFRTAKGEVIKGRKLIVPVERLNKPGETELVEIQL
jgi:hypothetical protein